MDGSAAPPISMIFAIALACGAGSGLACSGLAAKPYTLARRSMTAVTTTADTIEPAKLDHCTLRGVAPSQYDTLNSVTSEPVIDRQVQTTPPIRSTPSVPSGPVKPSGRRSTMA